MIYRGFLFWLPPQTQDGTVTVEFMNRAIEAEREACAKVCEELPPVGEYKQWERATLKDCAAAIRARGQGTPERGQA
jgi:hypothetical protein